MTVRAAQRSRQACGGNTGAGVCRRLHSVLGQDAIPELRLEMQGQIDGLKIIVSSLLHALPDQRPFAFRFREVEGLARKQNALPSTLATLRWFRTQMERSAALDAIG
jgi:hypothetical protein